MLEMSEFFTNDQLAAMIENSAWEAFHTMLELELESLPFQRTKHAPSTNDGVLALVGFAGSWSGAGAFSCTTKMACGIAESLLMTCYMGVQDDVLDAVGEMANIILGNVKGRLEESLGPMYLSVPAIVYGRDFSIQSFGQHEWVLVPFQLGDERIEIQLYLTHTPAAKSAHPGFILPFNASV